MTMPLPRPSYASEAGWRCIDALLPEAVRLDPANEPTEEWLTVGAVDFYTFNEVAWRLR
jgi:hypothetical protein